MNLIKKFCLYILNQSGIRSTKKGRIATPLCSNPINRINHQDNFWSRMALICSLLCMLLVASTTFPSL